MASTMRASVNKESQATSAAAASKELQESLMQTAVALTRLAALNDTSFGPSSASEHQSTAQAPAPPPPPPPPTCDESEQEAMLTALPATSLASCKHPLRNTWSFWFYKKKATGKWQDNVVSIGSVAFVEDFWRVFNYVRPVASLPDGCDYMFFKEGIQPMWEDPANEHGGRIIINMPRSNERHIDSDTVWVNTLLGLIGSSYGRDGETYVNGAAISVRYKTDRLSLWTSAAATQATTPIVIGEGQPSDAIERIGFRFVQNTGIFSQLDVKYFPWSHQQEHDDHDKSRPANTSSRNDKNDNNNSSTNTSTSENDQI